MNKNKQKYFLIFLLVTIIIILGILIYFKKEKIKEYDKQQFSTDLVETRWNLDRMEVITNEVKTNVQTIEHIELVFFEKVVNICTFYAKRNYCSINNYNRSGDTYTIEKNDLTNVYGTIKFNEDGNIYLEQIETEDYKTIYYFKKMS